MEWKRLYKSRTWWWILLVLFILTIYFFSDSCGYQEFGDTLEYWKIEQTDYAEGYEQYLDKIIERADQMAMVSIFNNYGSFSQANIEKTKQAAIHLQKVRPDSLESPFVERWLQMDLSDYLFFILMFYLISFFQQEKKENMWILVRLSQRGRTQLLFQRMGLLIPLFCSFTTGFYLIRFFITLYYWGGFHQWGSPVQSLEAFALCGLPISLGSYAYLHILWKMLAQVLVTGFFFAVFSVVRERKFSYLISGAALLFEYIAYTKISSSSMLGILTWFNLFALLDPYQSIGVYQNLNFFGTALGNTAVVMIFALAMFLTGAVMLLYSQKAQYPIMDTGKWVYNFRKIVPKIKKPRLSSAWLLEGKKLYLLQKGLVLLFILALIQGYRIERQMQFYSVSEQFQLQYYEEYGGVPTEEKMQLAQKETDRLEEQIQGAVTDVERKSWMDQKVAFDIVYTELQRIWMLKQEGNNVELINPEGYERLMNWEGSLVSDMLLCIAWILLFSLGSWYRERQNGMIELLRPSNKGLGYVQRMKMSWTAIYSLIAFGLVFGVRIKNILYRFPITGLTASVKSLFWMESNSGPLWMYLVGNYIFLYGGISVIWITGLILAYLCFLKKTG